MTSGTGTTATVEPEQSRSARYAATTTLALVGLIVSCYPLAFLAPDALAGPLAVVALLALLGSSVPGLISLAPHRGGWISWLVVGLARTWTAFWASLCTLLLITAMSPALPYESDQFGEGVAFGWPRRWTGEELLVPEQQTFSLSPDVASETFAAAFWADWYVATAIMLAVYATFRFAGPYVLAGVGAHRLTGAERRGRVPVART